MKALVYDTETTGVIKPNMKWEDIPQITEIAAILFDDNHKPVQQFSTLLSHENIVVPETEFFINNGMSTERCRAFGVPPDVALTYFATMANMADCIVAHNQEFDWTMVDTAFQRYINPEPAATIRTLPKYCTMLTLQPHLKIPDKYVPDAYKTPGLQESYKAMVNPNGFKGAHDAMQDVKACAKLFFACIEKSIPLVEWKPASA